MGGEEVGRDRGEEERERGVQRGERREGGRRLGENQC
jgi:hypothetical protein